MASHGYAVYGNDHLGHGGTATERDRGYFADANGDRHVVNDLHRLTGIAMENHPGLPVILLGHSMGSYLARAYCARYPETLAGAVLMGTGGRNPALAAGRALTALLIKLHGRRAPGALIDRIAFGSYCKRCAEHRTTFDWLNTDPGAVDRYQADPLCGFLFTLGGFADLFHLIDSATKKGWTDGIPAGLPILITSGEEDPVGAYGAGVRETFSDLHRAGVEDLTIVLYEGMRHEILNEPDRQRVYDDILEWADRVAARGIDG